MSALFNINFRRESYLREVARARRRVIALGVWVAYFGVIAVVLGLYGLNCASLSRRVAQIERQAARARIHAGQRDDWKLPREDLVLVERYVTNAPRWRVRLERLASLVPANARLTSIAVNPDNLTGPLNENKLVISGRLRISADQDRMRGVVQLVSALRGDSAFAAQYGTIRLANTHILEDSEPMTEFVIECQ